MEVLAVGADVVYCGRFSNAWSLNGRIENVNGDLYGIRNVNGNFDWVHRDKVKELQLCYECNRQSDNTEGICYECQCTLHSLGGFDMDGQGYRL